MNARQFYNLVVRMRKAQRDYDTKPSEALEKIPAMLEGLGIHDYNLDNIIERRVRPIIMNAEYAGYYEDANQ